ERRSTPSSMRPVIGHPFPFWSRDVFEVRQGVAPPLYRRIVAVERPGLFFAGLVQPIGPTIPLVEIQARWMAKVLSGQLKLPAREEMLAEIEAHRAEVARRYLNSPRYTLEVDFREYARVLEADLR